MTQRFRSLDENWGSFLESPIKEIREGRMSSDPAVITVACAVEMLGLRIQYLQSIMIAMVGGQTVNDHDFFEIPTGNQVQKSG